MELCERGSLRGFMASLPESVQVPEATLWSWLGQLVTGLDNVHAAGLVRRLSQDATMGTTHASFRPHRSTWT